jgi:hypothetical protein
MDRAIKRKESFPTAFGREINDERLLTREGLANWVLKSKENEDAARILAAKELPSRKDMIRAGLPYRDRTTRRRVVGDLQSILQEVPKKKEVPPDEIPPEKPPVAEPPVVEPAPEVEEEVKEEVEEEAGLKSPLDMTPAEYEQEVERIEAIVDEAEKDETETPITPEQRRIYEESPDDWEAFSRARGYTDEEIEQFKRWLEVAPPEPPIMYKTAEDMYQAWVAAHKIRPEIEGEEVAEPGEEIEAEPEPVPALEAEEVEAPGEEVEVEEEPEPVKTRPKKAKLPPIEPEEATPITVEQIDQAITERTRSNLFVKKGNIHVPGLRQADQEEAGRLAYLVEKGEATVDEWDKFILSAVNENRFTDEEAPIRNPVAPEAAPEPEPVAGRGKWDREQVERMAELGKRDPVTLRYHATNKAAQRRYAEDNYEIYKAVEGRYRGKRVSPTWRVIRKNTEVPDVLEPFASKKQAVEGIAKQGVDTIIASYSKLHGADKGPVEKPEVKEKEVAETKPAEKEPEAGPPEPGVQEPAERKTGEPVSEEKVTETEEEMRKRLGIPNLVPFDTSPYKGLEDMTIRVVAGQEKEMAARVKKLAGSLTALKRRASIRPKKKVVRRGLPKGGFKKFKGVNDRVKSIIKAAREPGLDISEVFLKKGNSIVVTNGRFIHIFNTKGIETGLKDGIYHESFKPSEVSFPPYKEVIPKSPEYKGEDNALNMIAAYRVAAALHKGSQAEVRSVAISVNPDKTMGFTASDESGNYAESNVQEGAELIGYYDVDYMNDLLTHQAKTGDTIKVYSSEYGKEETDRLLTLKNENGDQSYLAPITGQAAEEEAEKKPPKIPSRTVEEYRARKVKVEKPSAKEAGFEEEAGKPKPRPGQEVHPFSPDAPETVTNYNENSNRENPLIFGMADMLEILRLAEAKLPKIFPKIGHKDIAGRFWPVSATIGLKADIFIGPTIKSGLSKISNVEEAKKAVLEEILEENPELTEDDIQIKEEPAKGGKIRLTFYKIDPSFARRVAAHEIGHWTDYMPEGEIKRGNILGRLAKLKQYLKHTIDRLPTDPTQILTQKERKEIRRQAEKRVGPRPPKDEEADLEAWRREVSETYRELIEEEIESRDLITQEQVMKELRDLTHWWKPFNAEADESYTKYRYSSPELYADALSVLLNNPAALQKRAPIFYDAFFNYLERNPTFQRAYDEVMVDIRRGTSGDRSVERIYESFNEGDEVERKEMEKKNSAPFDIRNTFGAMFFERFYQFQRLVNQKKKTGLKVNPMELIDFARYTGSQIENYVRQVGQKVINYLRSKNLNDKDLGTYLALTRAINERSQMANPVVGDLDSAKQALKSFREQMGPVNMDNLEAAKRQFRRIREELILDPVIKAQAHTPELINQLVENEHYATFEVIEYLDKQYGSGTGLFMFPQFGTVKNITNPVSATMKTDVSLIWALNWNQAKMGSVDFYLSHYPNNIKDADKSWNGKRMVFKDTKEDGWGLVTFQRDGKTEGYYIDTSTAEAFRRLQNDDFNKALRLLRMAAIPARLWFTTIRPGFQLFNTLFRDPTRSIRNLPKLGRRPWVIYKDLYESLKAVKSEIVKGIDDATLEEMRRRGLLISWANYAGMDTYNTETERLLAKHSGTELWNSKITNPIKKIFSHLLLLGNIGEIANKRAGFQYLKDNQQTLGLKDEQIDHMVRHWAGSPSFITGGKATPVTNNLFLFSNAIFQGWRSDIEALKESPNAIAKALVYGVTPKAMMLAFTTGAVVAVLKALGADDDDPVVEYAKWMGRMYDRASTYDKTNYTVIPLFESDDSKAAYLRIPQDEFGRVIGGLFYKLFEGEDFSTAKFAQDALRYMGDQGPGINPVISAALDVVNHLSGGRVYDSWRERPAVPDLEWKAPGLTKHKKFGQWFWNNYGGSFLFKFRSSNPTETKTWFDSFIQYPFMGDTIGRFFKKTNYGLVEKARRAKERAETKRTGEILDTRNAVARELGGAELTEREKGLLDGSKYADTYRKTLQVRGGDQIQSLIDMGDTDAEKKAIIDSLFADYDKDPAVKTVVERFIGKQLYSVTDPPVVDGPKGNETRDNYWKRKARREKSISDAISMIDGYELDLEEAIRLLKAEPRMAKYTQKTRTERIMRLRRLFSRRPPKPQKPSK